MARNEMIVVRRICYFEKVLMKCFHFVYEKREMKDSHFLIRSEARTTHSFANQHTKYNNNKLPATNPYFDGITDVFLVSPNVFRLVRIHSNKFNNPNANSLNSLNSVPRRVII